MTHTSWTRYRVSVFFGVLALAGTGCTSSPTSNTDLLPFDQAVTVATQGLISQTQKLPAFLAKVETLKKVESKVTSAVDQNALVIDPMLDGASGLQTNATKDLEHRVVVLLQTGPTQFAVLPFNQASLSKAKYVLVGTLTREPEHRHVFQINLALVDYGSGNVVAQSSARTRDDGLDTNPTPYYRDSPFLVNDDTVKGYTITSQTVPGQPADSVYYHRVPIATLINQATESYDAGNYSEALTLYSTILASPNGQELRVLNGVYLAHWRLGHVQDAEAAFGRVVSFGLANNNLGVKFLFSPGTTEFWPDPQISGPYRFWLRQIGRQTLTANVCLNVIGHTSHTGSEDSNQRLSLERATSIVQKLDTEAPGLTGHLHPQGMGFKENLVGTGTDDARDALDRRVEFKVTPC